MAKLHELLAAEKTVTSSWTTILGETLEKMKKPAMFEGETVSLKMIEESESNAAVEAAARVNKQMPTTVPATLEYALSLFAKAEDVQFQKNKTNTVAKADIEFRGKTLASDVPVDELMGLESRLEKIRQIFLDMPTLDATKAWTWNSGENCWMGPEEHTTKTDKKVYGVTLHPATDKHPAQVHTATEDKAIGKFTKVKRSGNITAVQKSEAILAVDELIAECKKARQRANNVDLVPATIGKTLVDILLAPIRKPA